VQICENCARDTPLRGIYIAHFDQISAKISVLGSYTLTVAPVGMKFGMEEGTFGPLHAKFHPNRCNVSPLWGAKPQNRPLSDLNTGALHNVAGNKLQGKNIISASAMQGGHKEEEEETTGRKYNGLPYCIGWP